MPYSRAALNTFSQPILSVGGVPVKGKTQHSNVPRRKRGLPFNTNLFPILSNLRKPKDEDICEATSLPLAILTST